ncbi:hypothetical protein [Desulfosarcina ovata]|uniref:Uncharacterized protein n=1 Tax=Desulfosarcina ovata subsp. ovata TaxID=2752305 RepID=A0A5K8A8U7_9BACT|nr:hypothetical protein [Desulfosarcina ovata]BBO88955.1 hypothetical protein DSCOOX_21350 [Desulfosarcina ovata subsp. ovata]
MTGSETLCYAWALIPNPYLLLRTGNLSIATVMRRLLTGYAVSFNHRHRRHGRLFQNRYKSILCQEDPYLLEEEWEWMGPPLESEWESGNRPSAALLPVERS